MKIKRRTLYFLFLFSCLFPVLPLCLNAQSFSLGVSKDLGWAEWTYETIEFRDDCTILKGYFVPSENGCWVVSKMDETLLAGGKEYRIIYTTLPIKRHPRTTYKGGSRVLFEEHFEPIFKIDGSVHLTSHDISFTIPQMSRKKPVPSEDLFNAYEIHIDSLISYGKQGAAVCLLYQYVKSVLPDYTPKKLKKKVSKKILDKYRVQDFFLNASPEDGGTVIAMFRDIYQRLLYAGNDNILCHLDEISALRSNIIFHMNGTNVPAVIEWCETLMPMIRSYGRFNHCYEQVLSLYRKALVMDEQKQRISELDKEIIEVCGQLYNKDVGQYIERLMNIASDLDVHLSKTSYDWDSSIELWKEVRTKAEQFYPNSWRYAKAMMEIANYNYRNHHFNVALVQYLIIDGLYKEKRNEWISEVWYNHDYLTTSQSAAVVSLFHKSLYRNIGNCFFQAGDLANAMKYDVKNPYYYYALGDFGELSSLCDEMYAEGMNGLKGIIKKPTIIRPGAYYEEVLDIAYSPALTTHIPYFAYKTNSRDFIEKAYNGALVTKEFRLRAGNSFRQLLKETKDSLSIEYKARIDEAINSYHSMAQSHDLKSVDQYWEVVHLQNELIGYLDSIGALDSYFPDWINVRNSLNDGELAVEFIRFPLWNQNQKMFAALTLRKESEHPKLTAIFEESQLKDVSDTLYYQCKEMTDMVWTPLQAELEGIKTIYFSPTGALYNIGIEYLPGMETYNIYRLSSTRELMTEEGAESEKRAVLYGGLDYYANFDSLSRQKSHEAFDYSFVERANVVDVKRGMNKRGGKEELPHTKKEVVQIGEALKKADWSCVLDTAACGTEESFKALSGLQIRCLHLATHGFYYQPKEAKDIQYSFMQLDNPVLSEEDKALTRSGLILAGANHILEGDTIPENVEDGILTAKEIADVDLRGLDLVVLSACQTGLGDIAQGEGVFGLQRGFKKAGAKSILMSLWEVEDEPTQILMTQFYKNMLSGGSKHESLRSAQAYLREYDGGKYNAPKYWAAFILLDGHD